MRTTKWLHFSFRIQNYADIIFSSLYTAKKWAFVQSLIVARSVCIAWRINHICNIKRNTENMNQWNYFKISYLKETPNLSYAKEDHFGLVTPCFVNIGSDNDLLPDGIKSLSEPTLISLDQQDHISIAFYSKWNMFHLRTCIWKISAILFRTR